MKTVWVVMRHIAYEGDDLDSVWTTPEAADARMDTLEAMCDNDVTISVISMRPDKDILRWGKVQCERCGK